MQRSTALLMSMIAAGGLLLAACSARDKESIKLGWIGAQSGTNAILGQWDLHGTQLVIDEVNASGGVCGGRTLQLVIYDDEADPTKSIIFAHKLVSQDKVLFAFATTNSNTALADLPVFTKANVGQITGVLIADLTAQGSAYVFRKVSPGPVFESALVHYLAQKGFMTFAIISDSSAYGKGQADYQQAAIRRNKLESLARETYNIDDREFTQQLANIIRVNPQVLLLGGSEIASGLIASQARKLGFKGQIAGGVAVGTPKFIEVAGEAAEGVIFASPYIDNHATEQSRDFARRYQARWGYEPDHHGARAYDGAMMAVAAIRRACDNLTSAEIARQLHATQNYQGLLGEFTFQENGEGISQAQLGVIRNGRLMVVTD